MRPALLLLGVIACANPLGTEGAEPFDPPAAFTDYWADMERCAGVSGHLARIRWYVVPSLTLDGREKWGVWEAPHTIYLAREVLHHTDGRPPIQPWAQRVIQHEMLHDLTGPDHGPGFDTCGVR